MERIETVSPLDVAKALGTTPGKVKSAIKNGTMPIGMVAKEDGSTHERTIIIRVRWDKWVKGEL